MANEFVARNGLIALDDSQVSGSLRITNGITGSLFGTSSWSNSSISALTSSYPFTVTGSSIISYNASSASSGDGNFFGFQAGFRAGAYSSNFLGFRAGSEASGAFASNFLGSNAGYGAFAAAQSNFLGQGAGNSALYCSGSNFLGSSAGSFAFSSGFSNFLGASTGEYATDAARSNFFGYYAGYRAYSSSFSTFIGYQVGANLNNVYILGPNNIIIGTNITLGNGRRNSINLGGLIFGTGSYSTITGNPFSGSANGRVGINQPIPIFSLDVSGSGRYTNGLEVTGSLNAPAITGSLFGTSSWSNNSTSASYVLNAISSSFADTASSADNFTVRGTLTAQTIVAQVITSSTDFVTGSTRFGSSLSNTHTFTGSVGMTGSLSVMGGNFGIDTASPIYKLDISADKSAVRVTTSGASFPEPAFISVQSGVETIMTSSPNGGEYGTFSNHNVLFKTNNTERMRLTAAGNLLIGTTTNDASDQKLQVSGSVLVRSTGTGDSTFAISVRNNNGTEVLTIGAAGGIIMSNSARITNNASALAPYLEVYNNSDGNFRIQSNTSYDLILQPDSKNVGIGKTSPGAKLDVSGSVIVTGSLIVNQGMTGSLFGTSSWSNNAVTSSNALTASYVLNAVSASFASTSSFVTSSAVFGPFGANSVLSASFAVSAAWAPSAGTTVFPFTGSALFTGSMSLTGSLNVSGSVTTYVTFTNTGSSNYTLVLSDTSRMIEMTSSAACVVTVPSSSVTNFPIGSQITVVGNGAGQVTFNTGSVNVFLRSAGARYRLTQQYSVATLTKRGTDEWYLFGDLTL